MVRERNVTVGEHHGNDRGKRKVTESREKPFQHTQRGRERL